MWVFLRDGLDAGEGLARREVNRHYSSFQVGAEVTNCYRRVVRECMYPRLLRRRFLTCVCEGNMARLRVTRLRMAYIMYRRVAYLDITCVRNMYRAEMYDPSINAEVEEIFQVVRMIINDSILRRAIAR